MIVCSWCHCAKPEREFHSKSKRCRTCKAEIDYGRSRMPKDTARNAAERARLREIGLSGDPASIELTNGGLVIFDKADAHLVSGYNWQRMKRRTGHEYAVTTKPWLQMHRLILGVTDPKQYIDHRNRYGLDNRMCNLRLCTYSQNAGNTGKRKGVNSSQFRGVSWSMRNKVWRAAIVSHGTKRRHLGNFESEEAAARAYDAAAIEKWGEFALPNFPIESRRVS